MHKSFGSKGASTLESSQQLTQWLPDISKGLQHAITAAADTLLLHVQAVATSCLSHLVRQCVQDGPAGCKLVYSSSHCLGKCLQLQLWVSAGVVHFDWTVNCTAASQQMQLRHPTAQVACTPATALGPHQAASAPSQARSCSRGMRSSRRRCCICPGTSRMVRWEDSQ